MAMAVVIMTVGEEEIVAGGIGTAGTNGHVGKGTAVGKNDVAGQHGDNGKISTTGTTAVMVALAFTSDSDRMALPVKTGGAFPAFSS